MLDVITFGSATVDIFVNTENKLFRSKGTCVTVPFGAKIAVNDTHLFTGGGGTNTAAALSSVGLKVGYCGKIGDDEFADTIVNDLKKFKVNTSLLIKTAGQSAFSVILDSAGHDRTILTYKGVSNSFKASEVTNRILKKGKHYYLCSLMGVSFSITKKVISFARRNKRPVAFNPSNYLISEHKKEIIPLLKHVSYLICNKEEAELLTRKQKTMKSLLSAVHKLCPTTVVITDGKRGIYAYNGSTYYTQKTNNKVAQEATGAGDAFGASFFGAIVKGKDMQTALQIGSHQAESIIQHYGAKQKLLTWNQLIRNK